MTIKAPSSYAVFCTVHPNKRNGITEKFTHRVGPAASIEDAREKIANDRKAMRNTFGGLIDAPGDSGRVYQVFKAEWTEVTDQI